MRINDTLSIFSLLAFNTLCLCVCMQVVSGVSKLKCTINWVDENGSEILCVTASWTVAAEAAAGSAYAL